MAFAQQQVDAGMAAAQQAADVVGQVAGEDSHAGKLAAATLGAAGTGAALGAAVGGPAAPIASAVGAVIGAASVLIPAAVAAGKKRRAASVDKREVRQLYDEHVLGMWAQPGTLSAELNRQAAAGRPPRLTRAGRKEVERIQRGKTDR